MLLEDKRKLQFLYLYQKQFRTIQYKVSYSEQIVLTNNPQNIYLRALKKTCSAVEYGRLRDEISFVIKITVCACNSFNDKRDLVKKNWS
jgi:hypothetical protein